MAEKVEDKKSDSAKPVEVSPEKESPPPTRGQRCGRFMLRHLLTILTISSVIIGTAIGIALKQIKPSWTPREVHYVKYIGDIFLNMLKCLIIPLIITSLITAIGSMDISMSKKIGGLGILYYVTTTISATILGIILAITVRPGRFGSKMEHPIIENKVPSLAEDTILDLIRNMFPPNIVEATLKHYKLELISKENVSYFQNNSSKVDTSKARALDLKGDMKEGINIMGVVVFCIFVGIAISILKEKGRPVLQFFTSFSEITMILVSWAIWFTPVGVPFLIIGQILKTNDLLAMVETLGLYFVTVLLGLFIHGLIILPLLFFICTKKFPLRFTLNMAPALFTAFGTSSSSATLPITLKCLEEDNGIDKRVSRFLAPIGSTINMDGTALYEAVAAIFIAQLLEFELNVGQTLAVSVTATAAAIGAAGIPQAGLVTMVMVLNTVGLPGSYISYIIPVDWLLDRFRTTTNVLGDCYGAGILNHLCKSELERIRRETDYGDGDKVKASESETKSAKSGNSSRTTLRSEKEKEAAATKVT